MGYPTKIATCCFCGSRTALKLDKGRHELACASCGAPLREMKMLPKAEKPAEAAVDHRELRSFPVAARKKPKKVSKGSYRKKSKRKGWWKDAAEELFDFVEDIFD